MTGRAHARRAARAARYARSLGPGCALLLCAAAPLHAEETDTVPVVSGVPQTRPAIMANRWQENWAALSNPALRTQPFDWLKYIPLSATDPYSYLSLGATLRERFESSDASGFGVGGVAGDSYLLQRFQFHVDVHVDRNWELFTQFEDVRAFGKNVVTPVDKNPLDLRLAFLSYVKPLDAGTFKARIGRQDFLFDLQRFVSSRDGPNVRQSFDAIWADWEAGPWRFIGFVSQPVEYRDVTAFDDTSSGRMRFHTLRVERHVFGSNEWSAYYSLYERGNARYPDASGSERRNVYDMRFAGAAHGVDWDLEAMGQTGAVGGKDVRAWAGGSRVGYTFGTAAWKPRIGVQFDAASGDRHAGDGTLGTFNPLFPNGYYFTLGGFTGYANLIHLKPSITVKPAPKLSLMAAVGFQWRETTGDAVYTQPAVAVNGTAGRGSLWTGAYGQLRADYAFNANLAGAVEAVYYQVGSTIRDAGGHNSEYLGIELKFGW
ncbi:alginate export protein [Paraburkholderia caballeronis]|uniref:alginate export family protein n=1 Tax=Paraburkholderia caballeronis TaxID=416943 RepID=UPI001065F871|nr:alginate export family protein [Paraburkholderia caballeronis]TDV33782.1 alginate export protein [Paraburkholderia caballeronis]